MYNRIVGVKGEKKNEKDIEDKVISLNDSATWELFKKLVSE